MKTQLRILIALVMICDLAFSQFKLEEGPELDIPKGDFKYKGIIGSDESNFYAYRLLEKRVGSKVNVECYDSKTLNRVFSKEILIPAKKTEIYSSGRLCTIDVKFLNNSTFIFYSLYDDEEQKLNIYLITVDNKGNSSLPRLLASPEYNYELVVSPDKMHFGMIFLYRDSLPPNGKNPMNYSYHDRDIYNFYDAKTGEAIISKNLSKIHPSILDELRNYSIDDKGSLSFLRFIAVKRYSESIKQLDLGILPYNKSVAEYFPISLSGRVSFNLSSLVSGNLLVAMTVDNLGFARMSVPTSISDESAPLKVKYEMIDDVKSEDLILRAPVRSLYFNQNTYTIFNPNQPNQGAQYIGIAQIDPNGKLNWFKYMDISVGCDDILWTQKYKTCFMNNKLCFYFNDNPSNDALYKSKGLNSKTIRTAGSPKDVDVVCLSVDENGVMKREIVYHNSEFMILPSPFDIDPNTHFLRMYSKKKEKFARIK